MPGQKKLEELVQLQTLEDALENATSEMGPAQAAGKQQERWSMAEEDWRRIWTGLLATLLAEDDLTILELRTLRDLSARALPKDAVVSRMPTVERALDRLLDCIKLERMVEERTLPEYRAEVESRFRQVNDEADTWFKLIDPLERRLEKLIDELRKLPKKDGNSPVISWNQSLADSLASIRFKLTLSKKRLDFLQKLIGEPARELSFVEDLSPIWTVVDESFGTWVRRLVPALWVMIYGSLLALSIYLVVGMFIPTPLVLWIGLGFAFVFAVHRYLKTRKELNKKIDDLRKEHSNNYQSRAGVFWTSEPDEELFKKLNPPHLDKTRGSRAKIKDRGWREKFAVKVVIKALAAACYFAAYSFLTIFGRPNDGFPPTFHAFVNQAASGSPCWIAEGTVLWAGPGRLVMSERRARSNILTVLAPNSFTGLTSDENMKRCEPMKKPTPTPPGDIGKLRLPATIIIPFQGDVSEGCDGNYTGDGTAPNETAKKTLRMISDGLKSCYPTGVSGPLPPSIDVIGFASNKEFACDPGKNQSQLNLGLAEHRRDGVLRALGAKYEAGRWQSPNFVVDPSGPTRWKGSYEEMKAHILYDHQNDPIGRYVLIEVNHAGTCARA